MRKSKKILEIEKEYRMEYVDILKDLHDKENMSIKQIAVKLNCDSGNLSRQFKKLGIKARTNKEAFANWWETTDEEGKKKFMDNSIKRGKELTESFDKPIKSKKNRVVPNGMSMKEYMQTKEYKRKISKANSGKNNGMYKKELSDEHRVKTRGMFGYKKWSKEVRERDNHTCKICGKAKDDVGMMVAHHLDSYDTHEELRLDLDNGITLCNSCHNKFHNKYKGQKTTKEQFYKYLSELHL